MDRWACVNIPELPLQLLERHHPEWKGQAVVVVDHDKPNGVILWANEGARHYRILPGMRFAAGLSLCGDLRAGTVESPLIQNALVQVERELQCFSPSVEPAQGEPGVFWLDASGLRHLYASLYEWAEILERQLYASQSLRCLITVGFSRFGTYALARAMRLPSRSTRRRQPTVQVWPSAQEELREAARVPLDRLNLPPKLRDALFKLGVKTVGNFVKLPPGGLKERFGPEAFALHRKMSGLSWQPIQHHELESPAESWLYLDHSETDTTRLLFIIKRMLIRLLEELHDRHQVAHSLEFKLCLDTKREQTEALKTATPTLDLDQWLELIRLRLESLTLKAGIREVNLKLSGITAAEEQLRAFAESPRRDLEAAARAFARLRAEFGEDCVVGAKLREGHLPEASFSWERLESIGLPSPTPSEHRPLVRRVGKPQLLPPRQRHERDDGWLVKGVAAGPAIDTQGPFTVSGGWWVREVRRDYYFVQLQNDELLWIFFDRHRRKWFLHGEVV